MQDKAPVWGTHSEFLGKGYRKEERDIWFGGAFVKRDEQKYTAEQTFDTMGQLVEI